MTSPSRSPATSPYSTPPRPRQTGTVRRFADASGYGFITPDDGTADVFVHFSAIMSNERRRSLFEGQRVAYDLEDSGKGPRAARVEVLT